MISKRLGFEVAEEFEALEKGRDELAVEVAWLYLFSGFIVLSHGYLLHTRHVYCKEPLLNNTQQHTETIQDQS